MEPIVLLFIGFAAFLGLRWYQGGRQNREITISAAGILECVFAPLDTTYTNIGGVVGYNFVYELDRPFRRLEGTITTLPRQAVLYLPISRVLLRREDQLLFTLYFEELKTGQGHIVEEERYRRGSIPVADPESLSSTLVSRNRATFRILWYNPMIRDRLREVLDQLSDTALECVHYIGYYGSDNYIAFTVQPTHPQLEAVLHELKTGLVGL